LGVEHEYLNEFDAALEAFYRAVEINSNHLGADNPLIKNVNNGIISIKRKQERKF
jgi:hypothetical protein